MKKLTFKSLLLLCALIVGSNAWADTVTFDATTDVTEGAQSYQTTDKTYTSDADGSEWIANGYGATAYTCLVIGKGGANYLKTPVVDGTISSVAVTWSGNTSYYLALQTTEGEELEAKQNPSTSTEETFTISSGSYSQLQLVGRRATGTSNAAATITQVVVTYTPSGPAVAVTGVELNKSAIAIEIGKTQTLTATIIPANASNKTITWSTDDGDVATVSKGVVTAVAEGTTTITATSVNGIEATCDVTVFKKERVFYESFNKCNGTGGNDGAWSGSIASNNMSADNNSWSFSNAKGADQCGKFGTGSNLGSATTPALGKAGDLIVSFKAGAWDGNSESTNLKLSKTAGDGTLSSSSVTMDKGAWKTYYISITGASTATKIKFEGNSSSNSRFFLDEIIIKETEEDVFIGSTGWATYSSDFPLDLANLPNGLTAYQVLESGVNSSAKTITPVNVAIAVAANTGLLLKGTPNTAYAIPLTTTGSELSGNKMVAVSADGTEINSSSKFVLTAVGGDAVFAHTNTNKATLSRRKAYLDLSGISLAPSVIRIVDEENNTTNVKSVEAVGYAVKFIQNGKLYIKKNGVVYDMLGTVVR